MAFIRLFTLILDRSSEGIHYFVFQLKRTLPNLEFRDITGIHRLCVKNKKAFGRLFSGAGEGNDGCGGEPYRTSAPMRRHHLLSTLLDHLHALPCDLVRVRLSRGAVPLDLTGAVSPH